MRADLHAFVAILMLSWADSALERVWRDPILRWQSCGCSDTGWLPQSAIPSV